MRYKELKISADRESAEMVQALLTEAGFDSMQIDDPRDAIDIAEHPDIYKYDYINEEILQTAARAAGTAGLTDQGADQVTITLYFADDEEGADGLADAEELLRGMGAARQLSTSQAATAGNMPGEKKPDGRTDQAAAAVILPETGAAVSEPCTEENLTDTDRCGDENSPAVRCSVVYVITITGDDSEWLYKWQEHFKPAKVGSRIVVKPSWEYYDQADGELIIEMDPGMAFGSGLHETTSMCIKALEKAFSGEYGDCRHTAAPAPGGLKVLDVGTGTGILAIAAALLGAADCLGIDIDDEAVRVAGENVAKNALTDRIDIAKGDLMAGVSYVPDIIAANLMADLVIRLSPAAAETLKPGGIYITSGIIDIKEETVAEAVQAAGFEILEIMRDGEWRAIVARK